MNRFNKLVLAVLMVTSSVSFILYGVWEEKILLYAPLLTLLVAVSAVWLCGGIRRIPPGGIPLLIFWVYSAALIPFAVLPYEAKISVLRFGCYLAVYWASANLFSRFSLRKTFWTALFVMLALTSLYSLIQHFTAPDRLFGMERYTQYWTEGRLGGTYQCPNHIAHLVQMWLPFCLVFMFIPFFGWFWRICFAYGIGLFGFLIYHTESRAGLLGAAAALAATVFFLILRRGRKALLIALPAALLVTASTLGGLWYGSEMFRSRMTPVVKFFEHHMDEEKVDVQFRDFRPLTWADTVDMIRDRPVFGFGPGNYGFVFEGYRSRFDTTGRIAVHPHNEYLELVAEYGLVGAVLVLWVLIAVCRRLIGLCRSSPNLHHALPAAALLGAMAGTAVHGFFDFELRVFPNAFMLALLAGSAVAPVLQTDVKKGRRKQAVDAEPEETDSENHPSSAPARMESVLHWVFTLAVVLAAGWSVQVMGSAWLRARGDRLFERQEHAAAERLFKISAAVDPQNWRTYHGLGQIYYLRSYYDLDPDIKFKWALEKRAVYEKAYRINPVYERISYELGQAELALGDIDRGLDLLRQTVRQAPFSSFYLRRLGIELRRAGFYDEALTVFERARRIDRSNPTVRRNIEWIKNRPPE